MLKCIMYTCNWVTSGQSFTLVSRVQAAEVKGTHFFNYYYYYCCPFNNKCSLKQHNRTSAHWVFFVFLFAVNVTHMLHYIGRLSDCLHCCCEILWNTVHSIYRLILQSNGSTCLWCNFCAVFDPKGPLNEINNKQLSYNKSIVQLFWFGDVSDFYIL